MRPWDRPSRLGPRTGAALAAVSVALALSGCTGGVGSLGGAPLPYQHANAFVSQGYSETLIGPDRYRIEVKGPATTPRARMEKIAATRAAEIGRDHKLGFFKIDNVQHTTSCKRYTGGGQRGGTGLQERTLAVAVLTAEVSYAKTPPDAGYVEAKSAFDQYRAELDQPEAGGLPPETAALPTCG